MKEIKRVPVFLKHSVVLLASQKTVVCQSVSATQTFPEFIGLRSFVQFIQRDLIG